MHRHQPGYGQPGSGPVLQQTGNGGAADQGRQAGRQDDAAELPPIPVQLGAAPSDVIAHNLVNFWRRLVLPKRIEKWSLMSLQQRLVKTGGRLIKHARYYWLLLAESHLTRHLFGSMVRRIEALPVPAG